MIHETARLYGNNTIGDNCWLFEDVIVGYPDGDVLNKIKKSGQKIEDCEFIGAAIQENALIRSNTIIYCKVSIGRNFRSGHRVLIRENTVIGENVMVGSNVIIEGHVIIGNNVSIQSNVYIPTNSIIDDFVFIGPSAVLSNDKYPPMRIITEMKGPILRRGVSVGANATILPGVEIGEGSMVAAGAVVVKNVPPWTLAIGIPARFADLPVELRVINKL
jgi:acetyltransferase-like isoleucine patch superfamily enzyme